MRRTRIVLTALLAPPLFFVVLTCATAAAVSWLGRESPRFDLLTHFAPIWFAGGAAGVLAALLLRGGDRLLLGAAGVVALLAAGGLILPELTRSTGPKAPKDAPGQLKVIQFNVWHYNRDPAAVVAWLAKEDADLAILEETTPALRDALAAERRWQIACGACEVMILAKQPPVSRGSVRTQAKAEGPLTRATYRDARGEFTVLGVHYAWPTDAEVHQAQERRLAEAIGKFPRERTTVAGDFNSTPWSFSRRRWDRAFGLIRRDRAMPTWPARQSNRFPWLDVAAFLPIDHVYAGAGWATVSVRRGPKLGSDHYPVVVTLAPVAPR
jgi:endonuclease/exonuclease/phosphatase (EEP) superfamily protein YafD